MAKEEARDWYTGCSALGATGLITPEPVTTALGAGALVGQGIGLISMGLWNAFAMVGTDIIGGMEEPQTGVLASLPHITFPKPSTDTEADEALTNINLSGASMVEASRLVYCSLNKLKLALEKNNLVHINRQQMAVEGNLQKLETAKWLFEAFLKDISRIARTSSFKKLSVSPNDVLALRDEIVSKGGFPDYEKFVFESMAASDAEILMAIDEVGQSTGEYLKNDLTGGEIFDMLAKSLSIVNIRNELMPDWAVINSSVC